MKTIVRGKNVEVPDRVRDYAERKLRRLERMLDDRSDAVVELSNEQHRSAADAHIAEVTLVIDGQTLRSHASRPELPGRARQRASTRSSAARSTTARSRACGPGRSRRSRSSAGSPTARPGPARERRIVKTKRFAIEPMFEEDALSRMEELGHEFFVFVSAETEQVAILYERDDGDYGVIEPMIGGEYTKGKVAGTAALTGRHDADVPRAPARQGAGIVRCRECFPAVDDSVPTCPLGGGHGQGGRAGARDRRRRDPGLRRQPDRLAPPARAAARAAAPSASDWPARDIGAGRDPRPVPGQPGRAGRRVLRALGRASSPTSCGPRRGSAPGSSTSTSGRTAGPASRPASSRPRRGPAPRPGRGRRRRRTRRWSCSRTRPAAAFGLGDGRRRSWRRSRRPRPPRGSRDERVGFCLDTAHAWGAGIDLANPDAIDAFLADFDARIGLDRLVMVHLNDSKAELGSRHDRHEHVGAGRIGAAGLAHLLRHPALAHAAYYLETPGMDEGYDAVNMAEGARPRRRSTAADAAAGGDDGAGQPQPDGTVAGPGRVTARVPGRAPGRGCRRRLRAAAVPARAAGCSRPPCGSPTSRPAARGTATRATTC